VLLTRARNSGRLRYAAYGSNLHPVRLTARTPSATLLGTGRIDGMSLRFHKRGMDGSAKCNIVAGHDQIHVAVFEIESADARRLDAFEGPGYRAETIRIADFGDCFVYLAHDTHVDDTLTPYTWYRDLVVAGCDYLRFPRSYTDIIAAVPAEHDPDAGRHGKHAELIDSARAAAPLEAASR
jgi:gamma-glutamylcyclotransferase